MLNIPANTPETPLTTAEVAKESRREPRFSYLLTYSIGGLEIPSANISSRGAQLCCPCMRYDTFLETLEKRQFHLSWNIPEHSQPISAGAVLRYANLCEDEYLIGLEFKEFYGDSEQRWRAFIDALAAERVLS